MNLKIKSIKRDQFITFVHNKSIEEVSKFLTFANCRGRLEESLSYKIILDLHKRNNIDLNIDLIPHVSVKERFTTYNISLTSRDIKQNMQKISYGYVFLSRLTNKCFGIIY